MGDESQNYFFIYVIVIAMSVNKNSLFSSDFTAQAFLTIYVPRGKIRVNIFR